jgi:hypothetical protein
MRLRKHAQKHTRTSTRAGTRRADGLEHYARWGAAQDGDNEKLSAIFAEEPGILDLNQADETYVLSELSTRCCPVSGTHRDAQKPCLRPD